MSFAPLKKISFLSTLLTFLTTSPAFSLENSTASIVGSWLATNNSYRCRGEVPPIKINPDTEIELSIIFEKDKTYSYGRVTTRYKMQNEKRVEVSNITSMGLTGTYSLKSDFKDADGYLESKLGLLHIGYALYTHDIKNPDNFTLQAAGELTENEKVQSIYLGKETLLISGQYLMHFRSSQTVCPEGSEPYLRFIRVKI